MQSRGIDILMEQLGARKKMTDFHKGERPGPRDHLISLSKPKYKPYWVSQQDYDVAPECLTIREFRASGKTLVTTMSVLRRHYWLILIAQQQIAKRPGRIETRVLKRRPKAYPLLMLPRAEATENVRKYGHPNKLK